MTEKKKNNNRVGKFFLSIFIKPRLNTIYGTLIEKNHYILFYIEIFIFP